MSTERIQSPFSAQRRGPGSAMVAPPAPQEARPAPRRPEALLGLPLRALTGFEEEVVELRQRDPNTAALCNEIVARCAVAPGADHGAALERVRSLSTVERDAALVQIRRISLGDQVQLEVSCPACGKKNDVDFALSALPLPSGEIPAEVTVALPEGATNGATDRTALARTPTAGDQEDLLSANLGTESERRTFLLARVLVRYGDAEGPFDATFVRGLPTSARFAVERAIEAAVPDFDLSMAVRCAECGTDFSSPFDVVSFFLPR